MSDDVKLHTRIASLEQQLANREAIIGKLLAEIKRLKHRQFGSSSERVEATLQQLGLALEAMQSAPPPVAETPPAQDTDSKVTPLRRPRALPPDLPRQVIVHAPEGHCPDCGTSLRPLGEDVSEMLHWVPGHFEVIRHVRPKLSCGQCSRVVQQPAPSRPIPRAMATPGLLAQVVISKYADHLPLYRQAAIYRRAGLELHRATLADWVGEAARLVAPLADALGRYVRAAAKVHADDTPLPVLDPGRGKTRTARLWTYVRDDRPAGCLDPPAVWYRYSPDRKGIRPQTHLAGFTGILQADGYAGYAPLYAQGVREAACWAHARRKFHEVYAVDQSPLAGEAIRRIGLLYAIERDIRGELPAVRCAVRQARASGLLDELHDWLSATLRQVSGRSSLAAAIQYSLVRWEALTRYCDDGRIEIDNNPAERSIRALVLGRKNYLFAGSDAGGEHAANLYSLINTALLNGIEPHAYLSRVFEVIADHPINRIEELLPWHLDRPASDERKSA
ncbi:MAG: IS66 family transposase [Betaproteobacteria bacterium]|nr:IS66 family transposase [Betaproteobacteria bacterium]